MTEPEPATPEATAQALLDAQVTFLAATLGPAGFAEVLETEVDALLAAAGQLTLGQVVTREQIKAVAIKYAVLMRMPGSIPEIASDIADRVYNHPAQDSNRLEEVFASRHVEELVAKFLELPLVREQLLASPVVLELTAEWAYRIALDAAADLRGAGTRVPGVSTLLGLGGRAASAIAPDAAVELETRIRAAFDTATGVLMRRARDVAGDAQEPWVQDAVIDLWRERAQRPVASLRELFSQEDLEEILVMLYDLWLSLRETPWLHALIDEGVDFFFDTYTQTSLLGLLQEFGVGRDDLIEEAQRFAPPILALLSENSMLEAFLRRRLEPFFRSGTTLALLARD